MRIARHAIIKPRGRGEFAESIRDAARRGDSAPTLLFFVMLMFSFFWINGRFFDRAGRGRSRAARGRSIGGRIDDDRGIVHFMIPVHNQIEIFFAIDPNGRRAENDISSDFRFIGVRQFESGGEITRVRRFEFGEDLIMIKFLSSGPGHIDEIERADRDEFGFGRLLIAPRGERSFERLARFDRSGHEPYSRGRVVASDAPRAERDRRDQAEGSSDPIHKE